MNFLVDVNLSPKWTTLLRHSGFSATRWIDIGAANATDEHIIMLLSK